MSHDLRLVRVFDAAPEVVFGAFIDPDAQKDLYGMNRTGSSNRSAICASGAGGTSPSGLPEVSQLARPTCSRWSTGRGVSSTHR